LIAQGVPAAAAELLKTRYETALNADWGYGLIAVRILQALSAPKGEAALEFLTDALYRAQPGGYVRTFVDSGIGLVPLLMDAAQRGVTPEYSGRILAALGKKIKLPAKEQSVMVEPLSERELECSSGDSWFIEPRNRRKIIYHQGLQRPISIIYPGSWAFVTARKLLSGPENWV
jgi:LuxR family maltose regulon positive regulatory protein